MIIRRGPSRSSCTIGWDLTNDTFKVGQWVRARIYERRCDLSPDGRHLIYFALNGRWSSKAKGSWTAISRAPYLKAIGLWANGTAWHGGGLFVSNSVYWINDFFPSHEEQLAPHSLRATKEFPFHESYGGECPGVYYIRLQRDGWTLQKSQQKSSSEFHVTFEKKLPKGWVLQKTAHASSRPPRGKGVYHDTHRLIHSDKGTTQDFPDWEWADFRGNRLYWTTRGVLFKSMVSPKGISFPRQLFDFNPLEFEDIRAPY
ncbi:MAG: hypothetical protein ACFCU4_10375 [Puniceicoccaceae bacterium]